MSKASENYTNRWQPLTMKFIKNILPLLILLSACSSKQTLHIKTDNAKGIDKHSPIQCNGVNIGQLVDIAFNKETMVVFKLEIDKEVKIPKDSKFTIQSLDLIGPMGINIKLGSENELLSFSDTILVQAENNNLKDSLTNKLNNVLISLSGQEKQDSILNKLNQLQSVLDSLKNGCQQ